MFINLHLSTLSGTLQWVYRHINPAAFTSFSLECVYFLEVSGCSVLSSQEFYTVLHCTVSCTS